MIVKIKRRLKTIGFRFDAMAAFLMCQQYGVDLNTIDTIPKEEYTPSWVWSAHRSFCMWQYKKPLSYDKMKGFIARMRKAEWDKLLEGMAVSSTPQTEDKKKVQAGMNSSQQGGKQE